MAARDKREKAGQGGREGGLQVQKAFLDLQADQVHALPLSLLLLLRLPGVRPAHHEEKQPLAGQVSGRPDLTSFGHLLQQINRKRVRGEGL